MEVGRTGTRGTKLQRQMKTNTVSVQKDAEKFHWFYSPKSRQICKHPAVSEIRLNVPRFILCRVDMFQKRNGPSDRVYRHLSLVSFQKFKKRQVHPYLHKRHRVGEQIFQNKNGAAYKGYRCRVISVKTYRKQTAPVLNFSSH